MIAMPIPFMVIMLLVIMKDAADSGVKCNTSRR